MICHLEAFLWLCRVYSISFNTVTAALQRKSWQNRLVGTHMILSCSMMCKNSIGSSVKSLKTKWRYKHDCCCGIISVLTIIKCLPGNCCGGHYTAVIWRAPYELHWMHQCGLQIYKEGVILWYLFYIYGWNAWFSVCFSLQNKLFVWQTFSWMSKVVMMFMLLLIST